MKLLILIFALAITSCINEGVVVSKHYTNRPRLTVKSLKFPNILTNSIT